MADVDGANAAGNLGDGPLPPFPPITSVQAGLPNQSDPMIVNTSADRLNLWADSDESSTNAWVNEIPGQPCPISLATIKQYWDGVQPADYTLTLRRYWLQVPGAYTLVLPGDGFEKTYTTTIGISDTDSETLSAELGVSGDGLSAKISASFSQSVTTSTQTSDETKFTVGGPATGLQRVWVLWQLVDEIVALTPSGDIIPDYIGEADVEWVNMGGLSPVNGAFMHYKNRQQAFPSQTYMPQQADFPA